MTALKTCLFCGHYRLAHDGNVDPKLKATPKFAGVKWTKSACSVSGCACRTWEAPHARRR